MSDDHDIISSGNEVDAIEAAKRLILSDSADATKLRDIALDRRNRISARLAAIFALGFAADERIAGSALIDILADPADNEECRGHAAEALAHVEAPGATALLAKILLTDREPVGVKRWCVYALGEIGGTKARSTLKQFAKMQPGGEIAEELRIATSRD